MRPYLSSINRAEASRRRLDPIEASLEFFPRSSTGIRHTEYI